MRRNENYNIQITNLTKLLKSKNTALPEYFKLACPILTEILKKRKKSKNIE